MAPYDVVQLLVGLSRLDLRWRFIGGADELLAQVSLSRTEPALLALTLTLTLTLPFYSSSLITTFYPQMTAAMTKLDARAVGDVLWGMGSMGANWARLPTALQTAVLTALEREASRLGASSLSSALWALAKMNLRWRQLPSPLGASLIDRVANLVAELSPQQSAKAVWALGTLSAPLQPMSQQSQQRKQRRLRQQHKTGTETGTEAGIEAEKEAEKEKVLTQKHQQRQDKPNLMETVSTETVYHLIENVAGLKKSKIGNAVASSQTLTGLAKLGVSWNHHLEPSVRDALWDQVLRVCQSGNEKTIANTVWALGSLGAPSKGIPAPVLRALVPALCQCMQTCSAWSLSNVVWGLARMGFDWPELPERLVESIVANVGRVEDLMNPVDVGVTVWSLGAMSAPLDLVSPQRFAAPLFRSTLRTITDMRAQEVSSLVWGLSGAGLSWDQLPPELRWSLNVALRRVGPDMRPQDVANCAYALSLLCFDAANQADPAYRGVHEVMLEKIRISSRGLKKELGKGGGVKKAGLGHSSSDSASAAATTAAAGGSGSGSGSSSGSSSSASSRENNALAEREQLRIFARYVKLFRSGKDADMLPRDLFMDGVGGDQRGGGGGGGGGSSSVRAKQSRSEHELVHSVPAGRRESHLQSRVVTAISESLLR
jgi:hypothetical protein